MSSKPQTAAGALITARLAGEQGREVFAVPGEIFSELSTGTHKLINDGAKLINTVDDLLNELPPYALNRIQSDEQTSQMPGVGTESSQESPVEKSDPKPAAIQPPTEVQQPIQSAPPPGLTPDERTIFNAIEAPSSHIDTIVRTTQLPIGQVSSILLMLELKGIIQQLPGKQFAKAN